MREASFGRRSVSQRAPRRVAAGIGNALPDFEQIARDEAPFLPQQQPLPAPDLSPDEELQAWKAERQRERLSRIPWRQISLMAGLCFGIAGFVLPDSVNDSVQWLLYALMAASFVAGLMRRRRAVAA
ncbi:MAG TPA: hypothetical protein VGM36_09940 [Rhizomicrobium sp.]